MARKSVLCDIEQSGAQGPATLAIDLNLESMQFRQPRRSMGGGNSRASRQKKELQHMHYQPATSRQLATQLMRPPAAAVRVIGRHGRACVPAQESTVPIFVN